MSEDGDNVSIGAYLEELRNLNGLNYKQLARFAKVSDRSIPGWEAGRHAPAIDLLGRVLAVLGGALDDVDRIMRNNVSTRRARTIAQERFEESGELTTAERRWLQFLSPEERQDVRDLARRMQR